MVWADVVGGKKKGRLYSAGDLASNYKKGVRRLHIGESSSSSAATGRSAVDEQEIAELKRAIAEQQRIAAEQQRIVAEQQRVAAQQQEEARRTSAILAQVLQRQDEMFQLLARQQPPPPHSPPRSPHGTGDHVDDADGVEHLDHDQDYQDY